MTGCYLVGIEGKGNYSMKAFEQELIKLYNNVFYFAVSRVHDEEVARDITQSVMESACANIMVLKKKESFKAWVMKITRNKINEYYRGIRKFNERYDDRASEVIDGEIDSDIDIEDLKTDILQKLVHEEDMINIMVALNRLEQKYQDVLRLNIICEYDLIETSKILGVNVNTVRTWSARGLVKLKAEFDSIDRGGQK